MSNSNEVVIIVRPSFKKFCGTDACQAALFNHFLYWIARKAEGQPEDKVKQGEISWYGSAEQICNEGLDNSWSVNKVRKEVNALVAAGLVGQRHNPVKRWDQTMHYFIGEEQGKVIREQCEKYDICLAHLGLTDTVLHLLNLVNAYTKNGKCNCQIKQIDLPNMVMQYQRYSSKGSSKDTNKEGKSDDSLEVTEKTSSPSVSTIILSLEEQRILDWFCELEDKPVDMTRAKKHCASIAAKIQTYEQFQRLYAIAVNQVKGLKDETVKLGNMAKKALAAWEKEQVQEADQWWNRSKRSEEIQPSEDEQPLEELPVDWQAAELTPDLLDWIVGLTQDWHDEANMQANVEILREIYRQAQKPEVELYGFLTAGVCEVGDMPEYERMDRFFEYVCRKAKIPMPYTPGQTVVPIMMEAAV